MANETLVQAIKALVALAKDGDIDGMYRGYRDLFAAPDFPGYRADDQRAALKLMVLMKGAPAAPTAAAVEAYAAAAIPLQTLVELHGEPKDHELLGLCYVATGDEKSATEVFKAGLAIERERSPQSDLCGALMKRISML